MLECICNCQLFIVLYIKSQYHYDVVQVCIWACQTLQCVVSCSWSNWDNLFIN